VFTSSRRVRLGDVDPSSRLRLDAIARYLQDVSGDDTADAYPKDRMLWVVRRTAIEVHRPCGFREDLTMSTWCSGLGSRWAERRVSLEGERGGRVEAASLWVCVDKGSGRPARLPEDFTERYGVAADVPAVDAKLRLPSPPEGVATTPWTFRRTDFDALDHVNNAAYWAVVEEELAERAELGHRLRADLEYGAGIDHGEQVEVAVAGADQGVLTCWLLVGGSIRAAAAVTPLSDAPGANP
jgi:acyl-ACP thioesterase